MSAVSAPSAPLGLFGQVRSAAVETWSELPRVIAAGAIVAASSGPAVVATISGAPGWLVAISLIPLSLLVTGLARIGASIARGDRAQLRDLFSVDAVLGLFALAAGFGALWAGGQDGILHVVGFALSAVWLVVVPRALAYGATRGRSGLGALRGGAILAVYRPGTTITLLGIGIIGAFAVVATLGVFILFVPALLSAFAARVTADELDGIDAAQGAAR